MIFVEFSDFVSYFILIFEVLGQSEPSDQGLINPEPLDQLVFLLLCIFEVWFNLNR